MARLGLAARAASVLSATAVVAAGCGQGGAGSEEADGYPSGSINIMAPGSVGGGWDASARAMQRALTEGGLVDESVSVYNVEGAAGTIGLAELATEHVGDPHQFMWMAPTLLGGIYLNDSPIGIDQVTPIARTHTGFRGVVVDADSEYQTFDDLVEAWVADPQGFSWAGGSAGGSDHLMIGSIAQAAGIDPEDLNFVATAGGGELNTSILSGSVSAGSTGVEELTGQVEAGEMRLLAVSSPERILDAPTFEELGYDEVVASSWFGLVAPGELDDEERDAMVSLVEDMVETEQWAETLEKNNWSEFLLTGDEFAEFLAAEQETARDLLTTLGLVNGG